MAKAGNVQWHGKEFTQILDRKITRALGKVAVFLVRDVKKSMGGSRFGSEEFVSRSGRKKKRRRSSPPGHPPAVQTARLIGSITHEVEGQEARVGTNVEYARRLELGFSGTDSMGRNYNQAPRPFLMPAVLRNASALKAMFKDLIE